MLRHVASEKDFLKPVNWSVPGTGESRFHAKAPENY
jgi:hypothetical protein